MLRFKHEKFLCGNVYTLGYNYEIGWEASSKKFYCFGSNTVNPSDPKKYFHFSPPKAKPPTSPLH